jgi:hypothetical protein
MLTTTAQDGAEVKAYDEGAGLPILIVHPGLDDGRSYQRVAAKLAVGAVPGAVGSLQLRHNRWLTRDREAACSSICPETGGPSPCVRAVDYHSISGDSGRIGIEFRGRFRWAFGGDFWGNGPERSAAAGVPSWERSLAGPLLTS